MGFGKMGADESRVSTVVFQFCSISSLFLLPLPHKPTRQIRRKSSKQTHAHGHQQGGNDTAFGGYGIFVAIAHRGNGYISPPGGIFGRFNIAVGILLHLQYGNRGEEDHQYRNNGRSGSRHPVCAAGKYAAPGVGRAEGP